jgi:hypothetical protein
MPSRRVEQVGFGNEMRQTKPIGRANLAIGFPIGIVYRSVATRRNTVTIALQQYVYGQVRLEPPTEAYHTGDQSMKGACIKDEAPSDTTCLEQCQEPNVLDRTTAIDAQLTLHLSITGSPANLVKTDTMASVFSLLAGHRMMRCSWILTTILFHSTPSYRNGPASSLT